LDPNFNWNEKHFAQISRLTGLNQLRVEDSTLNDDIFDKLNNLPKLIHFLIPDCQTTAQNILRLKRLDQLYGFNADGIEDIAPVVERLKDSTQLHNLSLKSCNLNNQDLKNISTITSLDHLEIGQNPSITEAGLEYLTKLPKLDELEIEGIHFDRKCIATLQKFKSLKNHLRISSDDWTAADQAALKNALPGCPIN
jgi:hypothetical protein